MSTVTKLNYTNETKDLIKDSLNQFGAGITDEDTFRSYVDKIKGIYNNWPKVTGTGTSVSLSNTKKAKMQIGLKGNTSQNTTTGKNLFNKSNANIEQGGWISADGKKGNGDNNKLFKLPIKPSTTYTIQKIAGNRFRAGTYQNDSISNGTSFNVFQKNDSGTSITITSTAVDTYLYVQYLAGDSNEQELLNSIQVEEGSTATSYEPYTGGIPSPNPSYPQNVKVVKGNNTITVGGKNLFDKNTSITEGQTYTNTGGTTALINCFIQENYIPVLSSTAYTMSTTNNYSSTTDYRLVICEYDANKNFIQRNLYSSSNKFTLTTTANTKFMRLCASTVTINELQLELGSTATTYEPYQGTSYPINLGSIELCKIDTYQDYIYKSNDKWYKKEYIGKVVLNGSETTIYKGGTTLNQYFFAQVLSNYIKPGNNDTLVQHYTNYFENKTPNQLSGGRIGSAIRTDNSIGFAFGLNSEINTVEKCKTWLSTHNLILYYILATPTDIEITDATLISQLEAIKYSYDNTTNISQTNSDLPFILDVSSLKGGN